jgi:hypothetical protein
MRLFLRAVCCASEEKTLKGESHERWGMKQGPKVFDMVNRQNGKQTIKTELIGSEANSRIKDPIKNQYAEEKRTSQESLHF